MTTRMKAGVAVALFLTLLKFGLIPLYEWQDRICQNVEVLKKGVAREKSLIGNEKRLNALLQKARNAYGDRKSVV